MHNPHILHEFISFRSGGVALQIYAGDSRGLRERERERSKSRCEKLPEIYKSERASSHIETDGTFPKVLLDLAHPSGRGATETQIKRRLVVRLSRSGRLDSKREGPHPLYPKPCRRLFFFCSTLSVHRRKKKAVWFSVVVIHPRP